MSPTHDSLQRSPHGQFIRSPHGMFNDDARGFGNDIDLLLIVFTDESVYGDNPNFDDSGWRPEGWTWSPTIGYVGVGDADPGPGEDHYNHFAGRWAEVVPGHDVVVLLVQVHGHPGITALNPSGPLPNLITHTVQQRPIVTVTDSFKLALRRAVDRWSADHGSPASIRRIEYLVDGSGSMRDPENSAFGGSTMPSLALVSGIHNYIHNELAPFAEDFDSTFKQIGENWLTEVVYAAWRFYEDLGP